MSDQSISVVPKKSFYPNNKVKAKEILEWLISRDILKPELSNCVLSSDEGYAISDGAKQISSFPDELPFNLLCNGLNIVTIRQVFDAGENGIKECICPNCDNDIAQEDWDFLNNWAEQKSEDLICPLCHVGTNIHKFKFTPEWGFSDLGFTFWNWPDLKNDFVKEFKDKLECDVSIVYQHI